MSISHQLTAAQRRLKQSSDSPRLDAELLLAHVVQTDRAGLIKRKNESLSPEHEQVFQALIESRLQGWPVAYLTNRQAFGDLSLYVTPDVLIPRPATELLVDEIVQRVPADQAVTIADIGTGSGAIALALALNLPHAKIIATDISPQALSIAHYNARHSGLTQRIQFLQGTLLEPLQRVATPDIIVGNLPYLRPDQFTEPSIQHEPRLALAGGRDGLTLVWRLLDQLHQVYPWAGLVLELHPNQVETVGAHLASQWPQYSISRVSDGQTDRGVVLWR